MAVTVPPPMRRTRTAGVPAIFFTLASLAKPETSGLSV